MSRQIESAAYHEAGHMTAAIVQAMPIRVTGLHVDLAGHGCADYFERGLGDLGMSALDHRERKFTMIALYAAHVAQLKFYPECQTDGWVNDVAKIRTLSRQMYPNDESAQIQVQTEMRERAEKLVDAHWPIIEELAGTLLAKPCTPMSQETINLKWGLGSVERNMGGEEIVAFFAKHNIRAKLVGEEVRNYDSTQDLPHYDSLA